MSADAVTERAVLDALRRVQDPDLHRDIVELGFVKNLTIAGGKVRFAIELTTPACPVKDRLRDEAEAAVRTVAGVTEVDVTMTANTRGRSLQHQRMLPGVKNPIAVASGKGGVGKSTTAVNLALALQQTGASVGLLDADIYGPSVPIMLGIDERPGMVGQRLMPIERYGLRVMSMGFLITESTPVVWRGPMVHNILQQFLTQVEWGELDYLVIDLPPGTGDAQLTLTQTAPLAGAVIVTTPQDVALADAVKGLTMFTKVNVPVLGIVENMSYFLCPHCNERSEIFGYGGGRRKAMELGVPFLGEIPIVGAIREGGDNGRPVVMAEPSSPVAKVYGEVAGALAARLSIMNVDGPAIFPGAPITWVSN